jgi:hypothetical protein
MRMWWSVETQCGDCLSEPTTILTVRLARRASGFEVRGGGRRRWPCFSDSPSAGAFHGLREFERQQTGSGAVKEKR